MTIGELIMEKRKELNLTLEDVGNAVGVSKATVSRWESGDIKKMKIDKVKALSDVLGIDPIVFTHKQEILSGDEYKLLNAYRASSPKIRNAALRMLEEDAAENKEKAGRIAGKAVS